MNKQHILDEIRRTAKANNGVPLGRDRFLRETGLKESDWYGRFWIRWSDALREAGFAANTMQAAYNDDPLIEKFIGLIRTLGHFPVRGEVLLEERNNPEFPAHTTFERRFGSKKRLAARIVEYCRRRGGLDDVVELCEAAPWPEQRDSKEHEKSSEPEQLGFVYLLKSGRYYKIGKTNAVGRRERELAIQLPEKAGTIHVIKTDDPTGIEAYWHKRFEAKRKRGEWFELNSADINAFRRRKFM